MPEKTKQQSRLKTKLLVKWHKGLTEAGSASARLAQLIPEAKQKGKTAKNAAKAKKKIGKAKAAGLALTSLKAKSKTKAAKKRLAIANALQAATAAGAAGSTASESATAAKAAGAAGSTASKSATAAKGAGAAGSTASESATAAKTAATAPKAAGAQESAASASPTAAKAAAAAGKEPGQLTGKPVRWCAFNMTDLFRNSQGTVLSHDAVTGNCEIKLAPGGLVKAAKAADLHVLTGTEAAMLPAMCDLRTRSSTRETAVTEAGGKLVQVQVGQDLLCAELTAGWHLVGFRAQTARHDVWPNPLAVMVQPRMSGYLLEQWALAPNGQEAKDCLQELRDRCKTLLSQPEGNSLLVMPIHGAGHWTLLSLVREPGQSQFRPLYQDSLRTPSAGCRKQAMLAMAVLSAIFGDKLESHVLPEPAPSSWQGNAWACGFHVLWHMEEHYRKFRGEGVVRVQPKYSEYIPFLQRWLTTVNTARQRQVDARNALELKKKTDEVDAACAATSTGATASAASASATASAAPIAAASTAAGAASAAPIAAASAAPSGSATTSAAPIAAASAASADEWAAFRASAFSGPTPEATAKAPPSMAPPAMAPAVAPAEVFGCGKCRLAPQGCAACNPHKLLAKAAKAKAKAKAEAAK